MQTISVSQSQCMAACRPIYTYSDIVYMCMNCITLQADIFILSVMFMDNKCLFSVELNDAMPLTRQACPYNKHYIHMCSIKLKLFRAVKFAYNYDLQNTTMFIHVCAIS